MTVEQCERGIELERNWSGQTDKTLAWDADQRNTQLKVLDSGCSEPPAHIKALVCD